MAERRRISWSVPVVAAATGWSCNVSCPWGYPECRRRVHYLPSPSPSLLLPIGRRQLPSGLPTSAEIPRLGTATAPSRRVGLQALPRHRHAMIEESPSPL